ncbi:lipopolysaccharide biosynthesis protein [Priestia megaterium]|uniref:lipopolysaccharide biosynthesis protein n=1 Tax=Priestia megaterium TaxID=1404 RepID=UPI001FD02364|nr:lipopolysaccharide biosynthesis protein [Priestia megaterium]
MSKINNLNKDLKSGFIVSAIGRYTNFIIQLVILSILSRILTPNEFGIVAIINVFLIFFNMLIDIGVGPAIIQNKELNKKDISGIFSFTVLMSIIISVIFAFMSKPISKFYENDELINACLVMSLALFTSGINVVPNAVLLKQKKFLEVNKILILANSVSGAFAVMLAYYGFSYFSLIINTILKNLITFIIMVYISKTKLTFNLNLNNLKKIYTFSRNQFLFNFINYFSRNLDNLLIGKYISPKELAFYDKAYTLSLYPNQMFTNVITPVVQPILSEYEQQKDIIKITYLKITKLLALIGMPITIFIVTSSKEIILILFGEQWSGSIVVFQILGCSIWVQMILSSTGAIFQSTNRTDLLLLSGVLSTFLNVISIVIGIITGEIKYIAMILVVSFIINLFQANYLLMVKIFNSFQREFYKNLKDPFIISLFILLSLELVNTCLSSLPIAFIFVIKIVIMSLIYIIGLKLTNNFNFIMKIFRR